MKKEHPLHCSALQSIEHESLPKLTNSFHLEYLRQFFIESSNQGYFQNLLAMRILELPLKRFDEKLPEIVKVKVIAQFWKALMFYARQCRILCLSRLISCFLKDQDLGPLKTRSWVFKDQISGFKDQDLWLPKIRIFCL